MNRVIFTGMPGVGKGTQAKLLIPYGIQHISTGELIRAGFKNNDPILMKYKEHIDDGGFLPDEGIFDLIQNNINSDGKGYVLDGAVRTEPQARFVEERNLADIVIYFHLTQSEATERLLNRNEGRSEDNPEAIKKRFKIYEEQTILAENYLRQHFDFIEVDASRNIEEIHKEVKWILNI